MLPETTATRRPNRTGNRGVSGAVPLPVACSRTGWLVIQAPTWKRSVQWSNAFAHDDAGNRTQWVKTAGSSLTYASATTNTVASEDVYYYHYDILGNVSVISDPTGDEADQFEQDAFGNLVSGDWLTRTGNITEQITTKPYDADLGLYYFNARWYDPQAGAFVSRDPVRGTLHYAHSSNSPLNQVDPSGLAPIDCDCTGTIYIDIGDVSGGWPTTFEDTARMTSTIARRRFSDIYPNAKIVTLSKVNVTHKKLKEHFEGDSSVGILFIGHGTGLGAGGVLIPHDDGLSASDFDSSKSDLQFFLGAACGSTGRDVEGNTFCGQSHASFCRGYWSSWLIFMIWGNVQEWIDDLEKQCDKARIQ